MRASSPASAPGNSSPPARARAGTRIANFVLAVVAVTAVALGTAPESSARPDAVLVIGDSLEVGTGPFLRSELGPIPLTIDARESRPSSAGVSALSDRLRPDHTIVVFDLGVNDDPSQPASLARNLAVVRGIVGDRCLIVATLSRPPLNGVTIAGSNAVVRAFVDQTPRALLFDWQAAAASNPALLGPDRVHLGPGGYAARAALLAREIEACREAAAPARPGRGRSRERTGRPAPRPRQRRRPRISPVFSRLMNLAPVKAMVSYTQSALDRMESATWDLAQAVSPRPPEPKLGELTSKSGRLRSRGQADPH